MRSEKYHSHDEMPARAPGSRMSGGIGFGMVVGLALGMALDSIPMGIVFGCAFGVALGSAMEARAQSHVAGETADGKLELLLTLGLTGLALMTLALIALLL